jgi:hypothetical protein
VARFEERLWAELVEQHGALLADPPPAAVSPHRVARSMPAYRRRLLPAAGLATVLTGVLVAIVIGLGSGSRPSAAFAVVRNPDGTVKVTIAEISGVQGANQRLAELGVPARVVSLNAGCATRAGEFKPAPLTSEQAQRIATLVGPAGSASVVLYPAAVPAGDTVVIGASALGQSGGIDTVALAISIYEGAAPTCLPLG